jgi:flagellar basal-body rod modification protein FlgD
MDVSSITSAGGAANINRFAEMSTEEFVKVLISELTNQDPLNPQDSGELLSQMSSIRNIESQMALQDKLDDLVTQNQFAVAGGLIGKLVQGYNQINEQVVGQVVSVRSFDGQVMLELDTGQRVEMNKVTAITDSNNNGTTAG